MFKAAAIFSDNMVLQREKNISVWGEADDGAAVTAEINGAKARCTAENGKWLLILPPMPAGGPYELHLEYSEAINENGKAVSVKQTHTFRNVMIGEVWLCGGQSNMELELQNAKGGKEELAALCRTMPIRFYYTNKAATVKQAEEAEKTACWGECDPEGSKAWSAVGYYFAKKLSAELGVTVGLIGCNWGGTSASAWVNRKTLDINKELNSYLEEFDKANEGKSVQQQEKEYEEFLQYDKEWFEKSQEVYKKEPDASWERVQELCGVNKWPGPVNCVNPFRPAGLYETMISRVCPYTLRGFLYYQGESDDHKPGTYYTLLTSLISLWRNIWGDEELPFIIVQLPMFKYKNDPDYKHWCLIREAQMRAFRTVRNTGIAVISDCGELDNIHPTDKAPVGERLCMQAEKLVYNIDVKAFGPVYKSYEYISGGIKLYFEYAENGFVIKGGEPVGFEIAGADKKFYPAKAEISGSTITISSGEVSEPVYARYCWYNYGEVNVYNETGIPLAPFRTHRNDE
ncbi:sialate O-acetylesterase [Ruminococcus sp. Marseille-P6503]|uniref:sialate O-acetylesterase n=1 Tax=Ruminococcus sp. Marseille-P6503 TaxID=2364796 RepID=UPI001FA9B49C|nr:sialate O-acetylesterase [Ruminococcus sp. Marseille-P6503]